MRHLSVYFSPGKGTLPLSRLNSRLNVSSPGLHLGCGKGSTSISRAGWGRMLRCSQSWNQTFKDGIFSESPDEVTRFTATFESRGTGHLCAYVVMGMEHLWYDALSYLLPVFQQKLLGCWSLLAVWPVCLHWAFTALLRTGRYWKKCDIQ